jgi:2-keto-4-pentenoate hydratase/2-oxohepta-3-ene-1,7-dioic acid hydratase in catechol pathway
VGIVIGRSGSNVAPAAGLDHVFGLTILNDWSARDIQGREMKVGLGPAKGKDFANSVGPVLVTWDEFADRVDVDGFLDLGMAVTVNGVETGRDSLANMGWPIADLVAYASRETWVHPGDLLGSGTCGNGGCLAELWGRGGGLDPRPLVPGDVVTMWVEGIGTMSTEVLEGRPVPVVPPARPRPRSRPTSTGLGHG